MDTDTTITLLVAVFGLLLGVLVLVNDFRNTNNKLFFAFNLFSSLWILSSLAAKFSSLNSVSPFVKIGFAAASLVVYFFLVFCLSFPDNKNVFNRWWHILLVLPLVFVVLSFQNLIAVAVPSSDVAFRVAPARYYVPYSIFLLIYSLASIVNLIAKYRKAKGSTRDQIFCVLLGASLFAFSALLFSLVMPLITHSDSIYRWGIYSIIFFLAFTAYAIIERGFLNIRVIITEVAVTIVIFALVAQTLLSETFKRGLINGSILIAVCYGGYLIITSVKKEIIQNKRLKDLTRELAKDKKELVELDRMKDEFLQMATHELNTPITVIKGKLDMAIREDMCKLNGKQKKFFEPILTDTQRLSNLSDDILNVARIDQHRFKIRPGETDLDEFISQIVSGFDIKAKERGNYLAYIKLSKSLPKLMVDQSKIGEVITNLINNANKFTVKGKIVVTSKLKDDSVVISVADTGVGIELEDQKHLFEKFYQAARFDPENPQEQQGSGLGLYISKNIIELHGGKIWLESEKGKGSTFYFSLPLEYKVVEQPKKMHIADDKLRML